MKIELTKVSESKSPEHPNNRPIGEVTVGTTESKPTVGSRFVVMRTFTNWLITSDVVKIIDDNTFETYNSIYKWREVKDESR